jgi:hypothetical protein
MVLMLIQDWKFSVPRASLVSGTNSWLARIPALIERLGWHPT